MSTNNLVALAHSTLGASTAERWTNCPASVRLSVGIESKPSKYAEEGTRAHEAAALFLTTGGWPTDAEEEMLEAVKVYTDAVIKAASVGGTELFIEQRLDLSSIHPKMFGTADAVVYCPGRKLLQVFDYKHGAGVPVDVEDNLQLQYYGLGALLMLGKACESVELVIVQPRCYHAGGPIRKWRMPAFDMLELAANLKDFALKTEEPKAPFKQGDHCRWCPAAGICPEIQKTATALVKQEFSVQASYDPLRLAAVLSQLDTVEAWAKSVREFAYIEAQNGRCPPGFKLVQKRSTRKWREGANAETLSQKFGGDKFLYLEMGLKSPAGVEKLLTKPQKADLDTFCEKVSSGLALVSEHDKRDAVSLDAKSQFKQIEDTSIFD